MFLISSNYVSWEKRVPPQIDKVYIHYDIFNAVRLALLCKVINSWRNIHSERDKYTGRIFSKNQGLVDRNADGMQKMKFPVIGKFINPHCLQKIKILRCEYEKLESYLDDWVIFGHIDLKLRLMREMQEMYGKVILFV